MLRFMTINVTKVIHVSKQKKKRKDIPYYEWQKYFNNYKIYVLIKCKYDTYV